MRSHLRNRITRTTAAVIVAAASTLGLAALGAGEGSAAPIPPGGSSAVMFINNKTGWPLNLENFPNTSVGAGSSLDVRWIDAPPAVLAPGATAVVSAWAANPADMGVDVTYSYNYRFGSHVSYTSSLGHILGFTNTIGTKASPGESVQANILQFGAASKAAFTLS